MATAPNVLSEQDATALKMSRAKIDSGETLNDIGSKQTKLDLGSRRIIAAMVIGTGLIALPSFWLDPQATFSLQFFEGDGIHAIDGWKQSRALNIFGIADKKGQPIQWYDFQREICKVANVYKEEETFIQKKRALDANNLHCGKWDMCRGIVIERCQYYSEMYLRCLWASICFGIGILLVLVSIFCIFRESKVTATKNVPSARRWTAVMVFLAFNFLSGAPVEFYLASSKVFGDIERLQYLPARGYPVGCIFAIVGILLTGFAFCVAFVRWYQSRRALKRLQAMLEACSSSEDEEDFGDSEEEQHVGRGDTKVKARLRNFNPRLETKI